MLFSIHWSSDYTSNEDLNLLQYVIGDVLTEIQYVFVTK